MSHQLLPIVVALAAMVLGLGLFIELYQRLHHAVMELTRGDDD